VQIGGTTAAQTLNWDSATNIVSAITNATANTGFQVLVQNQSTQTWTLGTLSAGGTTQYTNSSLASGTQRVLYFQITNVGTPAVTVWG